MAVISSPQLSGIEKGDVIAGLQACEADKTRRNQKTNSLFACSAAVLAWLAITVAIAVLFQQHAPVEYVDEVYHVRQTQRFCTGSLEYDPMITTFPGVYIVGVAWSQTLRLISWAPALLYSTPPLPMALACGTAALRAVNLLFGAACIPLLYSMHRQLQPDTFPSTCLAAAATCALLPPLFFLQFLFYTDLVSLVFVMTTHLAVLHRRYVLAAVGAAAAVSVRQNNAVWAAFSLGVAVLQECELVEPASKDLLQHAVAVITSAWQLRWRLLRRLGPLAAVPAAFVAFLLANGHVVIGDHSMHAPVPHLAHPLHFVLFAAAALAPAAFSPSRWRRAAQQLAARPGLSITGLCLAAAGLTLITDRFTFIHYYILTTGYRHYRNWLVRKALLDRWRRRCLVPAYLACGRALWDMLQRQSKLWRCAFAACTAVVLVPAALLEFRYFLVPFVMLALHMQPMGARQLALTAAVYTAINAATIYLFLFKPWHLADGSLARLMW